MLLGSFSVQRPQPGGVSSSCPHHVSPSALWEPQGKPAGQWMGSEVLTWWNSLEKVTGAVRTCVAQRLCGPGSPSPGLSQLGGGGATSWMAGNGSQPPPPPDFTPQLNWAPCQRALIRALRLLAFLLGMIDEGEETIVLCDVFGDLVGKAG